MSIRSGPVSAKFVTGGSHKNRRYNFSLRHNRPIYAVFHVELKLAFKVFLKNILSFKIGLSTNHARARIILSVEYLRKWAIVKLI